MENRIILETADFGIELFGPSDRYLKIIREAFGIRVTARDNELVLAGDEVNVNHATSAINSMISKLAKKGFLSDDDVNNIVFQARSEIESATGNGIRVYPPKGVIEPFTQGQIDYIGTMKKNDLTFCSGPAGTGKTYLAVAMAVSLLREHRIRKIVLVRPAVEAGEKLGFLPGDLEAKVNPYLRPLFDSLEDMMEFTQMKKFIEMDIIEVIPLAFMRGRTLNDAVIICDEAQNTTPSQMLMFLTRLGRNSKMIVTGDLTQVDLARGQVSGMLDAFNTLEGMEGIGFVSLGKTDIVRHKLVQNIVQAYEGHRRA